MDTQKEVVLRELAETSVGTALSVFDWAMAYMRDGRGYFYYQIFPHLKNRISYMRWSSAWMLLALATLLEHCTAEQLNS